MTVSGHCKCGAITYSIDKDDKVVGICHCDDCSRLSGSAFSVNYPVPKKDLTVAGEYKVYTTTSDAGHKIDQWFCGTCGSTLASSPQGADVVIIKAGTLDEEFKKTLTPGIEYFTKKRAEYVGDRHGAQNEGF